jgi:hypothetical protein
VVELSLVRAELVIRYLPVWHRAQGDPVSYLAHRDAAVERENLGICANPR